MTARHEHESTTPPPRPAKPNGEVAHQNVDVPESAGLMDRIIDGAVSKALSHANVRTVFGDPVNHGDRTVIPVARITANYGFGAGSGQGESADEDRRSSSGGGGGGGGRVKASPIGYIEMTNNSAQFVPIIDRTTMLTTIGAIAGLLLILMLPGMMRTRRVDRGKRPRWARYR